MVAGFFYQTSARQEVHTIQENHNEPEGIKCNLTKECVDNQLLSIFYIMKLYHDLKFNHTYIFSRFLICDGNGQLLIIVKLSIIVDFHHGWENERKYRCDWTLSHDIISWYKI